MRKTVRTVAMVVATALALLLFQGSALGASAKDDGGGPTR